MNKERFNTYLRRAARLQKYYSDPRNPIQKRLRAYYLREAIKDEILFSVHQSVTENA